MGPRMHGWEDVTALWVLRRFIRRLRPDMVHTHTARWVGSAASRHAWRRDRAP
jgi:hypothetical protein